MDNSKKFMMRSAGVFLAALQCLLATQVSSATEIKASVHFITPSEPLALQDIMDVDKLGFDCIREDMIDVAFHATGKGARLPRTCMPEPCTKALVPNELALLIGREAREAEWDEYFSRYAEVCRREIPPEITDEFVDGGTSIEQPGHPVEQFWTPLLRPFITATSGGRSNPIPTRVPPGIFSTQQIITTLPRIPSSGPDPTPDFFQQVILTETTESAGPSVPPVPAPVPLPAALWMLLAGLACFAPWKRRQIG